MEETTEKKRKNGITFLGTFMLIGFIPLLATAICLSIVSIGKISSSIKEGTYAKVSAAAKGLAQYYERDINNTDEVAYEHDYVDSLLDESIEMTLFIGDVRYITSLKNENGERNEGTKADSEIYKTVCAGNDYSAENVQIGDNKYFVYYTPIRDAEGNVVGMAFAGESEKTLQAEIASAAVSSIVIAIVFAIVFSAIVAYIAVKIKKPIVEIVDATDRLAQGNLNVEINLQSKISEINTLIHAAQTLQGNMQSIISGVIGDVEGLDSNMNLIKDKVDTCNHAAEGISFAVEELAKGTMDMAESVQNTALHMQEIGDNISEITRLASDASDASAAVRSESSEAKSRLEQLISANAETISISKDVVSGINESAEAVENIRQAADVIAQIASQTSLLALNASIEAARAGEAGRGFAVVAGEISNLATQSDASTQEIQAVVTEIIKTSEHNISLANKIKTAVDNEGTVLSQVSNSFDIVNQKVVESSDAIMAITDKANSLDAAKAEVLDEVSTLSAISEEDAASCQETNANMEEFAANIENINQHAADTQDTSQQLRDAVSYFRL